MELLVAYGDLGVEGELDFGNCQDRLDSIITDPNTSVILLYLCIF